MAREVTKPNIFTYFNYRDYLSALFNYYKAINPVFSHRYIVAKAGFKSPNSLKNVINGGRHLSIEGAERFAMAFKLDDKERSFFLILVKFNTARSSKEKEKYFSELLHLRNISLPAKLNDEQLEILNAWWHVAIREATVLPDFKNSALWISRVLAPPITPNDAAASLKLLKKKGFIRKTGDGWEPVDKTMQTAPEITHFFAAQFHRQMIQLGLEAIGRFTHELREISSTTLSLSRNDIPRIKTLLQNFRRQLLDFAAESQNADQVFQLNFQFFPLINPERPRRVTKQRATEQ